ASTLSRSRVERASLSNRVTTNTSPGLSVRIQAASTGGICPCLRRGAGCAAPNRPHRSRCENAARACEPRQGLPSVEGGTLVNYRHIKAIGDMPAGRTIQRKYRAMSRKTVQSFAAPRERPGLTSDLVDLLHALVKGLFSIPTGPSCITCADQAPNTGQCFSPPQR